MGKTAVDAAVEDLIGTPHKAAAAAPVPAKAAPPKNKAAVPPKNKAADSAKAKGKADMDALLAIGKKSDAAKAAGKPAPAPKAKAAAAKPAKPAKAAPAPKAAKPAPKAKAKAKAGGTRGARGTGKFYFDPTERTKVVGQLRKLKSPMTTAQYAEKHEIATWKVRLAASDLVAEKAMKLQKTGSVLTMQPK